MRLGQERKYKDVPLTELLDFTQKDIPFSDDEARDKQQDYKDELEQRFPFDRIRRKIERLEEQIRQQERVISLLTNHTHDCNGQPSVSIKKTKEGWRFE